MAGWGEKTTGSTVGAFMLAVFGEMSMARDFLRLKVFPRSRRLGSAGPSQSTLKPRILALSSPCDPLEARPCTMLGATFLTSDEAFAALSPWLARMRFEFCANVLVPLTA